MNQHKHTPGPWSWQPQGNNKHVLPRHYKLNAFNGKGLAVRVLEAEDEVWPKHPDARLIAAAPDLLEACKSLSVTFGFDKGCDCGTGTCPCCNALAAIKKATSNPS